MSYRRFRLADLDIGAATVATFATVREAEGQTVADVATVAGVDGAPESVPAVQSVAKVAGHASARDFDGTAISPPQAATVATLATVGVPEIRAMFEAIVRRLEQDHGRDLQTARRDALDVLRGELRNDARLAPDQPNPFLCIVCAKSEMPGRVLVPTPIPARPGDAIWLHLDCQDAYIRRQGEKIEALLRRAELVGTSQETDR